MSRCISRGTAAALSSPVPTIATTILNAHSTRESDFKIKIISARECYKRRAVTTLPTDEHWRRRSDKEIAGRVCATREYVNRLRNDTCDQVTSIDRPLAPSSIRRPATHRLRTTPTSVRNPKSASAPRWFHAAGLRGLQCGLGALGNRLAFAFRDNGHHADRHLVRIGHVGAYETYAGIFETEQEMRIAGRAGSGRRRYRRALVRWPSQQVEAAQAPDIRARKSRSPRGPTDRRELIQNLIIIECALDPNKDPVFGGSASNRLFAPD
jgi:hypothetical protein